MPGWAFAAFLCTSPISASAVPLDSLDGATPSAGWTFSVDGYYYSIPYDDDFFIPIVSADRGSLHLEARYNYEDFKTGSLFGGWTISTGEMFTVELTPMLGMAFGQTTGIVPAFELSLGYGVFDFYDESEYLIDLEDEGSSYLYSWLELGVSPSDLFRFGLTAQRTRVAGTPLEVERGFFLQGTPAFGTVSVYVFNPFTDYWFLMFGVGLAW